MHRTSALITLLALMMSPSLLPTAAIAQQSYAEPRACITESKASTLADLPRRTALYDCLLRSRSYIDAVKTLIADGYIVNSTLSKQIEFAETSGQRERAGEMMKRIVLP